MNIKSFFHRKTLGFFVKTKGVFSNPLFGGEGIIFMLHRVLPENLREQWDYNKGLAITPEYLEKVILYLKDKDFQFISLDNLVEQLNYPKKDKQKFVCFTIDDGYRDNITYGLPIFEKHNVPFTIYVSNSLPNGNAHFWWYWLEERIVNSDAFFFKGENYLLKSAEEKKKIYSLLRNQLKNMQLNERLQIIKKLFQRDDEQIQAESKELGLTWEELRIYAQNPLITFGAHTLNHLSLSHLSDEEAEQEIVEGKSEMEKALGFKINHFAYPYGGKEDVGEREVELVRKAGFDSATLNQRGNVFLKHKKFPFQLPRYALGNETSFQQIDYFLNGITHFGDNGWRKV